MYWLCNFPQVVAKCYHFETQWAPTSSFCLYYRMAKKRPHGHQFIDAINSTIDLHCLINFKRWNSKLWIMNWIIISLNANWTRSVVNNCNRFFCCCWNANANDVEWCSDFRGNINVFISHETNDIRVNSTEWNVQIEHSQRLYFQLIIIMAVVIVVRVLISLCALLLAIFFLFSLALKDETQL